MANIAIPDEDRPLRQLQARVTSFASDPLHSAAYLSNLVSYLAGEFRSGKRTTQYKPSTSAGCKFLYSYAIIKSSLQGPKAYTDVADFSQAPRCEDGELVFMTGYPSHEWLNAVVARYGVDYRFLQSHLDFLPSGERNWYTNSALPSRSQHSLRLMIPSIVFVGTEGRGVTVESLHEARNACAAQLQQKAKGFYGGTTIQPGQSIVRQVNIHTGDALVLEQSISIVVKGEKHRPKSRWLLHALHSGGYWLTRSAVIIWSDAGTDVDAVPVPQVASFTGVSDLLRFCPVFFETDLNEPSKSDQGGDTGPTVQPLSLLPSRYGETLEMSPTPISPFAILQEVFRFQAAAAAQYMMMLRNHTMDIVARTHATGKRQPSMDDILYFDYTKATLDRWLAHFRTLIEQLERGPFIPGLGSVTGESSIISDTIIRDLKHLESEVIVIVGLCESGKSTVISSFSVFQARESAAESKLVTQLTKATNRITFVFLPISFVTSVFGMNFKQFGQGPLSISLWVAVILPLLMVCVLFNECTETLVRWYHACLP
jgi:hypothetical protein